MRITLAAPPARALDSTQPISVPLGMAYLAGTLIRNGHDVTIIDAATLAASHPMPDGRWRIGADAETTATAFAASRPDLVGLSCPFTTRYQEFQLLSEAVRRKLPSVPILAGGIHPTLFPEKLLLGGEADLVVLGEGEETLAALARRYETSRKLDPEGLDGVAWLDDGIPKVVPRKSYIDPLDKLPLPARNKLDIEQYLKRSGGRWISRRKSVLSVITSRSCPGRCSYCSIHSVFGPKWRGRSPAPVVEEVLDVHREYHPSRIAFEDDRLTWDRERLAEICRLLIAEKDRPEWFTPNGVHVADLDEELLKLMKAAGCVSLNLAIESGDPHILQEVMGKKATPEQAREVAAACRRIGIPTNGYFVLGMPGETDGSLQKTLDLMLSLPLDGAGFFIATPFPGTRLHREVVQGGWIEPDKTLDFFTGATDEELFHHPLFETPQMSRARLIEWQKRFEAEFLRSLFQRKPQARLKAVARKLLRGVV